MTVNTSEAAGLLREAPRAAVLLRHRRTGRPALEGLGRRDADAAQGRGLCSEHARAALKPGRRFFERPIAEHVRAGHPGMAFDSGHEALSIDEYLVANPARTMLIRVKGDSMIDAGIHSGDTVVVEKRTSANVGDIVVAIIDNEFTLKRLGREKGQIVLRPENKAYPVIRPKGDLEIFGVVVGQFRKY